MTSEAVSTVGGLLPRELLDRVADIDRQLPGMDPTDFDLAPGERIRDAVTRSWNRLSSLWTAFRRAEQALPDAAGAATRLTRERWLCPLFNELGFAGLGTVPSLTPDSGSSGNGKSYAISHEWAGRVPVHLMGWRTPVDRRTPGLRGAAAASPHGLVQEFLNRSEPHLWGVVSNGRVLRLLRDNASLTRQAYLEFDLAAMFEGESFSDFALLWLCCHRTRFEGDIPQRCVLERWCREAAAAGMRARDKLRAGVERAIVCLGEGVLTHPANAALRARLSSGGLHPGDLQRQLLRIVYRMLFLLVAESRGLLLSPEADSEARHRYEQFYSMARLRRLAERRRGGAHSDLWAGLLVTMAALDVDGTSQPQPGQAVRARQALGLTALGGLLWSRAKTADLAAARIDNAHLLEAVRNLTQARDDEAKGLRRVDYRNLGTEELGSVYESLLEVQAEVDVNARTFRFARAAGSERKTTGSYYTPPELIARLLDDALNPVIGEARAEPDPQRALLGLKVLDPACGSGHFLIAAAHRIADALASVREGGAEPSPESSRAALREVVGRCVYGIDINPMAVELCKVSLWLEANTPGKPLGFLDHRIVCGNSLLGATPKLLAGGIPDTAFKALTGDDKKHASALRRANRAERKQRTQQTFDLGWSPSGTAAFLAGRLHRIDIAPDDTAEQVAAKEVEYARLRASGPAVKEKLLADAWSAAFTAAKTPNRPAITDRTLTALEQTPPDRTVKMLWQARHNADPPPEIREITRLADEYQFTHLHLAFPDVFDIPDNPKNAENTQTGWSGGFNAVIGNPPWERVKLQEKEFFTTRDERIATARNAAARKRLIAALATENPDLSAEFAAAQRRSEATSALLRNSGRFPLAGRGDINTYAVFAELMRDSTSPRGRTGAIVPTGIATDNTTRVFFSDLVGKNQLACLYDFENRLGIFPAVDSRIKFCLLTLTGEQRPAAEAAFSFFAHTTADLDDPQRTFPLTPADFAQLNPNTRTCPIFRTRRDAEITKAIYRRVPVLIDDNNPDGNPWGISFQSMFHTSSDSHLFQTRGDLEAKGYVLVGNVFVKATAIPQDRRSQSASEHPATSPNAARRSDTGQPDSDQSAVGPAAPDSNQTAAGSAAPDSNRSATGSTAHDQNLSAAGPAAPERYLPLFEAKMIHQFDHRWKTFHNGKFQDVTTTQKQDPAFVALPRYWVPQSEVSERVAASRTWLLGWRDITRSTDMRTWIMSPHPAAGVGDTLLQVVFHHPARRANAALHAAASSFASDFATRQKIGGTHLKYFTTKQLPVLPPEMRAHDFIADRVLELTYTAWDMAPFAQHMGYNGPPFRWDEERRTLIRAELDALMFHLYGINIEDADYIMGTFPIVKRKDEQQHGQYRTKHLILERYNAMTKAFKEKHGPQADTPNSPNPPSDHQALTTYTQKLTEALTKQYQTNIEPSPAHPNQSHPPSTRPTWASPLRSPTAPKTG